MKKWLNSKEIKRTKQVEEIIDIDQVEREISIIENWIQEYVETFNAKILEQQNKLNELKALRDDAISVPNRPAKEIDQNETIEKTIEQ